MADRKPPISSRQELQERFESAGYIMEPAMAAAIHLMIRLGRPLLVEGDAGVGKTATADALARVLGARLIRLQCYEGLDVRAAVYEWDYARQLLTLRLLERASVSFEEKEQRIYRKEFLLERPLLQAITMAEPPVLLVDEIDRADEEFEAYLLELLSDYQVTIPELGTIRALSVPKVILTSNATRELSDALRRRCLYYHIEQPSFDKEVRIVNQHLPGIGSALASQLVAFAQALRELDLVKKPGVAETLDFAAAMLEAGVERLERDPEVLWQGTACLVKTREDRAVLTREAVDGLLGRIGARDSAS